MKIQKLALGALLMSTTMGVAQAQTEAGKLLLGGGVSYLAINDETKPIGASTTPILNNKSKNESFNFSPVIGFFVGDNLALGLAAVIGSNSQLNTQTNFTNTGAQVSSTYKGTNKTYNVGPFVRYYKMMGEKIGFYGELSGGYQYGKYKSSYDYPQSNSSTEISRGGYASVAPGLVFFPTEKIGLQLTAGNLSYSKGKSKPNDISSNQTDYEKEGSTFNTNFGIQYLTLGASLHLGN
jgi:hypothetical protein